MLSAAAHLARLGSAVVSALAAVVPEMAKADY